MESIVMTSLTLPDFRQMLRQEIEALASPHAATAQTEVPIGVDDAATHLGIEPKTLYELVAKKKIPCHKPGKRLYFFRTELNEWIRAGRIMTNDDIDHQAESQFLAANKPSG